MDPDGDDITYTLTWSADGMAFPGDFPDADDPGTVEYSGDTVLSVDQDLADTFMCSATASDGTVTTPESTAFFDISTATGESSHTRQFSPATSCWAIPVTVPFDMTVDELGIIAKRTGGNGRLAL